MDVLYKAPFRRFVKKQARSFQLVIEDETDKVRKTPEMGEEKKGDLAGFRVHKFKFRGREYLMAYKAKSDCLMMYRIDTHENFYRDLKRHIKEVE